jgi:hypothetical protein
MTTLVGGGGPLVSKSFTAADSGDTLSAGPFNITNTSNGNFTVFGSQYQNLSFTVSNSVDNTSLVLSGINVDLAGNTINLGNGNNTVYGNIQDLSFSVSNTSVDTIGTLDLLADPSTQPPLSSPIFGLPTYTTTYDVGMNDVNVVLGGNTINVGNGSNIIYGTMRDLTMTDTGGNAITSFAEGPTGSQITTNTLINNVTIDLTGGTVYSTDPNTESADGRQPLLVAGPGNTITAGNGNKVVFGDMHDLTLTAGGAYANSTGLPASTTFNATDFPVSPNIKVVTDIQGIIFTAGFNHITLGNGTNTVYGDMQTLTLNSTPGLSIGYNARTNAGIGDIYNGDANVTFLYRDAPPYPFPPAFNNLNFNADTITVGNGNNVIYGHVQTLNFSQTAGPSISPGDFVIASTPSLYDQNSFFAQFGLTGTVFGTHENAGMTLTNITMGTVENGIFVGNTITAGSGTNTIYGDVQSLVNTIKAGIPTGTFPSSAGSSVYVPLSATFFDISPYGQAPSYYNTTFMAGNVINAGLSGTSTNTIYGSMGDLNFINILNLDNQGFSDNAEFCNIYVFGGNGVYGTGTYPGFSGTGPDFIPTLTGNTIKVGNGTNNIYGDMRDVVITDSGGVQNGLNNPQGLNGQPATTNGATSSVPFATVNSDGTEIFLGDNHITTGNGTNTVYGAMHDIVYVNGGVYNNGVITSNASTVPVVENVPAGGTDTIFPEIDNLIVIAGSMINVGSGINTIYGSMHDLDMYEFAGNSQNISVSSFASAASYDVVDVITMGHNMITTGSGLNTIDGDFHNINWSASGGINSAAPSGTFVASRAFGAVVELATLNLGDNTISAGLDGKTSINTVFGNGNSIFYSVVGGTASDNFTAFNAIYSNSTTMGDNTINIYGDGQSTIYGDVQSIVWTATGGHADGPGSYAEAQIMRNSMSMGGNVITDHGNGNDIIYGDAQTISLSVEGGTVTNPGLGSYFNLTQNAFTSSETDAAAYMTRNNFTFSGNIIHGGGGNDVIYASLQNLSFSAISHGPDAGAYFNGTITYPDGGSSPFGSHTAIPDTGNHFTFDNGSINGGGGNDLIIGSDVLNLSGLDAFLKPAGYSGPVTWHNNGDGSVSNDLLGTDLNQITFGNELLTGGAGNDTFEFTLLNGGTKVVANQGAAEVTDLGAKDVVQLNTSLIAEHTAASLDADHVATFTNSAAGCLITFNGAGSIMLDGVHFTSFVQMQAQHHLVVS